MLRNSLPIFLLCLCSTLLLRCDYRKYDEGPFFSIYPTEGRLAGSWQWQLALTADQPLTGLYADSTITFSETGSVSVCDLENNCRDGSWSLVSRRTRLQMIFGAKTELFDIRMLTRKEIWLQQSVDGSLQLEWELIPIE